MPPRRRNNKCRVLSDLQSSSWFACETQTLLVWRYALFFLDHRFHVNESVSLSTAPRAIWQLSVFLSA